tara:strand:- start:4128 stop:5189 length:1062 start_codon:yes stop_codon:yes gene_type:complete
MRFAHIGSFNRNLGDNVAIQNVRNSFDKHIPNIDWVSIDISGVFWSRQNDINFVKSFFEKENFDAIVVGGGGLIEYAGYEQHQTKFKLPFNKEIFKSISCPTFFVGLGINYFRGSEGFSDEAKQSLSEVIEYSTMFSLRNDGSMDILDDLGLMVEKVKEVPDPGLIFDYEKVDNSKIRHTIMEPAFNSSGKINENRFKGQGNIDKLVSFANDRGMVSMPHTPKDFRYFGNFLIDQNNLMSMLQFDNTNELVKVYLNFDSVIAMRGHGQLISVGLNVPSLYFSTQDKLKYFSLRNGFEDYNIDILENNWYEKLIDCHTKLLSDTKYLQNWYDIRREKINTFRLTFDNFIRDCKV